MSAAPTLRRSMLGFGGVLMAVALIAAIALVVITTALSQETSRVAAMDARLRASLRTKVALLGYARASDWAQSERTTAASAGRSEAEVALRSALRDMRRLALPVRLAEVDDLTGKSEGYVATRKRLEAEGLPLGTVIEQSTPWVNAAFDDLEHLVASDDAAVRGAETSAREWHAVANILGVSVESCCFSASRSR